MNPSNHHLVPSFTIPYPNPNPNFSYSFHAIPQNPSSSTACSSSSSSSSSSNHDNPAATLSILKNLIDRATKTLISVSDLLHSGANPPTQNEDFCCCPFDRRHRMPPESLFLHSLRCPSSPGGVVDLDGDGILESLRYPKTLKSEDELRKENRFVQPLQDSDADLCFSLDEYGDFSSNFFYRDCPGVVCSSEMDVSNRTFTLPGVLSVHCANFRRDGVGEVEGLSKDCVRILPSELWALQNEIELWNDYPCSYSFNVLQVALHLPRIKELDALKWIISNSPHYGVVVDVPMRDHIYILLRLCLKAISFEASCSSELLQIRASNEGVGELNRKLLSFSCPVLVEVLTWFASQLSVLYGETNGRIFAINLVKHCMLNATKDLVLYLSNEKKAVLRESTDGCGKLDSSSSVICAKVVGVEVSKQIKFDESAENRESKNLFSGASRRNSLIFVSQVAAAIAALHERSLLEEKIKGLRHVGLRSKSQMMSEHAYITKKAIEVRKGRPNYRPILEYDGLLWSRSHNEDSTKMKTKEELLAEERDYKRRRMSYRGKKVKRTITEVMRDIIEDHMEEIKQAGGIGCSVKGGAAEGVVFSSVPVTVHEINADVELKSLGFNSLEAREVQKGVHRKSLHSNNLCKSLDNSNLKDRQRRESHGSYEPPDVHLRSSRREKQNREYRSRSPEKYRSHRHSQERRRQHQEQDERKMTRTKYDENKSFDYQDHRPSSSMSNFSNDFSDEKYDEVPRYKGRTDGTYIPQYMTKTTFEDRYDPSESYDKYAETYNDISSGYKYARADKSYKSKR